MRVRRGIFAVVAVTMMTALAVGGIGVYGASAQEVVRICHATGNPNMPYVNNPPADASKVLKGHAGHTGPVFTPGATDWGDIIPPIPSLGFPGLNWDAVGQATHANACVPPELQPTPPAEVPSPPPPAVTGGVPGPGPGPGPGKQEPPAEAAQPAAPAELAFTGPAETVIWLGLLAAVFAAVGLVLLRLDTKRK
jgi:hypothetical protein